LRSSNTTPASDERVTVSGMVTVLLPGIGSTCWVAMVAVLLTEPPLG